MRFIALLAAAAMTSPAIAQMPVPAPRAGATMILRRPADVPRVGIGVTTTSDVTARDTLGVLVAEVRSGSPAEKAGIEEGNRIASINGVSLKLAAADVGEPDMAGIMTRRLTRELEKLKVGDEIDLRVYANGQTKSVKVKTVAPESVGDVRRRADDRATLGISIGTTGSSRDSLGVFVMSVEDNGPAARAGIEEGSRIASINGVDLRAKRDDNQDFVFGAPAVTRLERELSRVKPGDDVDLRVYFNGQSRNVKVKSVRSSDLPRRGRTISIMGRDNMIMPAMPVPPIPPEINERLRTLSRALPRVMMGFGSRVVW